MRDRAEDSFYRSNLIFNRLASDVGDPRQHMASALAGQVALDTTARNYEHLSPDYLRAAIDEVDAFFEELVKQISAHLRYGN